MLPSLRVSPNAVEVALPAGLDPADLVRLLLALDRCMPGAAYVEGRGTWRLPLDGLPVLRALCRALCGGFVEVAVSCEPDRRIG